VKKLWDSLLFFFCGSHLSLQSRLRQVPGHHTVNVKTTSNVRGNKSPKAIVVGSLKNGAVVYVYNTEPGGWSKIKYNNKAGYVASSYLTQNGSSSLNNSGGNDHSFGNQTRYTPYSFKSKYPKEKVLEIKNIDLDKDCKAEKWKNVTDVYAGYRSTRRRTVNPIIRFLPRFRAVFHIGMLQISFLICNTL
jgi:hypothetical protein